MITTIIRKNDRHKLYGLIVSESDRLILILKEFDFQFDGYQIIKKSDIMNMYDSDSNEYCEKIMRKEKLWKLRHPKWIVDLNLSNWHSVLLGIKCNVIIVENENKEGDFHIGPIIGLTKSMVTIKCFDGIGRHGDPDRVRISQITSCKFLDRYSTIHSKYLKPAKQGDASDRATFSLLLRRQPAK